MQSFRGLLSHLVCHEIGLGSMTAVVSSLWAFNAIPACWTHTDASVLVNIVSSMSILILLAIYKLHLKLSNNARGMGER